MVIILKINPLPLLKEENGKLLQCFDVIVNIDETYDSQKALLKVERNRKEYTFDLGLMKRGENKKEIFIPETDEEEINDFVLFYGEEKIIQKILVNKVKRWEIYLVLHSHTDLGFTAPVSEVAQIHNDNTDTALLYCNETEHWPAGSRFKWNCEVSWQVQNYIRDRSPEKVNELMKQVQKNNIEIGALYSGELTEILGHEQAVRSFYYAAKLRRDYNINIQTAMLCDVPGCTKGFVQIMAKSGIKNFIVADNNFIAPFLPRTDLPRPFYWCGDDKTKVLSWYTDHPFYAYIEGENYGLSLSYSETRNKLPDKLIELEKNGYAYDEFQLQYAFDNFRIEFRPAAIVREWNEKWAYPKIKLATASEFLNKMSSKYAEQIPGREGDWTNWWSGIVTGFPYETSQSRILHNKIPSLEILNSSLNMIDKSSEFYSEKFNAAYDQTLAFDEHSGSGMVWEVKSNEQQKKALSEGYGFIHNSFTSAENMEKDIKESLSKVICNDDKSENIAVFNTLNFERSGFVEIDYENQTNVYLRDKTSGKNIPAIQKNKKLKFYASDVPPFGYKLFEVVKGRHEEEKLISSNSTKKELLIENNYFVITTNRGNGNFISAFSKKLNKEIINGNFNYPLLYKLNPKVPFQLGKYIPEMYNGDEVPGELICFHENMICNSSLKEDELLGFYLFSEFIFDEQIWLTQKIYLENDTIKIENTLNGKLLSDKIFLEKYLSDSALLYFQFNFNIDEPELIYEAPCSVINPEKEQFKGACKDYYAMQNWCQIHNSETSIKFSSIDAPLIDVGEIALMKYRNNFTVTPQYLFVRAVSLNDVNGKNKSPYTDNPDLIFRFAISAEKYDDNSSLISANKFGHANNLQLYAVLIPPAPKADQKENQKTFFEIMPDYLHVMTIKKAEDNDDLILRLRETAGVNTKAEIKIPGSEIIDAYKTLMTEEIVERINIFDNSIQVELAPFAVETLRIKLNL